MPLEQTPLLSGADSGTARPIQATDAGVARTDARRIASLDGLRAVSILLVIAGHATSVDHGRRGAGARVLLSVLGNGDLGVYIFFVISGFLITRLLLDERSRHGQIQLLHFYIRRAFRILPAFYLFLLAIVVLAIAGVIEASTQDVLYAGTFTWIYNLSRWNEYLSHTWSLSVEEQFYLVWPAVLWAAGPRGLAALAGVVICALPVARGGMASATAPEFYRICYLASVGRFDVIMFGCAAGLAWSSARFQVLLRRRGVSVACWAAFATAVATCAIKQELILRHRIGFVMFCETAAGCGIAAGVLQVVALPRSAAGKLLNTTVLIWLGTISYSLYLWQQLFLTPWPVYVWQRWPWNVVCVGVAGLMSFYWVERPMIRWRVKRFPGGSAGPPL